MKPSTKTLILHELYWSVRPEGVKSHSKRIKVRETAQNYVPVELTKEDWEAGFCPVSGFRIGKDEILKVKGTYVGDRPNYVTRTIYFLDGQEDTAKAQLQYAIDETIFEMKTQIACLFDTWTNRTLE